MNREQLERDIIGAIMAKPEKLASVRNAVKPEHFQHYKRIVEAILTAFEQGLKFDFSTIGVVGKLQQEEFVELCSIEPSFSANLPVLLRALAEEIIRDEAMNLKRAITPERDAFELIDEVAAFQRKAEGIISANTRPDKLDILTKYAECHLKPESQERISTPFFTLNRMLHGGLSSGGFTLLGGTPGSGKTSFMLGLALHAAQSGTRTTFIEGEMTAEEILERLNGISTGEDIADLNRPENYERLVSPFVSKFYDLPFEIIPLYDRTLDRLASEVVAQVHLGAKLIFVDYLQVFTPKRGDKSDEFMEIRETSRRLRTLALQHGVHLFVASSLNRSEVKADKVSLNSFYGSSGLGHDCSVGLILSGELSDLQELIHPERNVVLHVVKNRSGPRGEIALKFHLRSQRFEELTEKEASERDNTFEDRDNGEKTF
jgi:replicative DNA helicase